MEKNTKYKSCRFVEEGLHFGVFSLFACCVSNALKGEPISWVKDYKGEKIDWDKLIGQKLDFSRRLRSDDDFPQECRNCHELKEQEWPASGKLKYMVISHWTTCNCDCSYCYTHEDKKHYNSRKPYEVYPLLKTALKKKLITDDGEIYFGGGEPTMWKELPKVLKLFTKHTNKILWINSSGIKYSKDISRAILKNNVRFIVSVDAGTREIYKKIKGVDCFDKVVENLKKYIKEAKDKKDSIWTKYIIIPNCNDNEEEIIKWINLSFEIGVTNFILNLENQWYAKNKILPDYIKNLIEFAKSKIEEKNGNLAYAETLQEEGYSNDK